MNKTQNYIHAILSICIILALPNLTLGQDRYCGIYAVYSAARLLGKPIEFSELVSKEFVSDIQGSTTADLLRAVDRCGLRGKPMSGLTLASLLNDKPPMILHVCSDNQLIAYNHWVLFLGFEDTLAVISEGNGRESTIPISVLLARWDGNAIDVTSESQQVTAHGVFETQNWLCWILVAMVSLYIMNVTRNRQVIVVLLIFAAISLCQNLVVRRGLFADYQGINYAKSMLDDGDFGYVTKKNVETMIGKALLIDARYLKDSRIVIPTAIRLPVDSSFGEMESKLAEIERSTPVVVYCQSRNCHFDRLVGIRLRAHGFRDVKLFKGGWDEWQNP